MWQRQKNKACGGNLNCKYNLPVDKKRNIEIEEFYFHVTVHRNKFLFSKINRRTNFPNLICQETLHVSGSSSAHHQEFSTVHSALVYVMQFWWQLSSRSICYCSKAVYKHVWHIPLLSVHWINSWWWTDELSETCRVSCQNKLLMMDRRTVM
jgi:hypothetical protein